MKQPDPLAAFAPPWYGSSMANATPLSTLLSRLRNDRGLAATATAIGVDRSTLHRWEIGRYTPDHDQLRALLDYYGTDRATYEQAETLRRAALVGGYGVTP